MYDHYGEPLAASMKTEPLIPGYRISRLKPLAAGAEKLVYPHPFSPDFLIKVLNRKTPIQLIPLAQTVAVVKSAAAIIF